MVVWGAVSLSAPWPQLREIPACKEAMAVALSHSGLPAGPPRGMGKARGPHRATLGLKTSTSTQRHKVCHLASGGPPITKAPKNGIKVLDLLTEQRSGCG